MPIRRRGRMAGSRGVSMAGASCVPRITCRSGVPPPARLAAPRDRDDVTVSRSWPWRCGIVAVAAPPAGYSLQKNHADATFMSLGRVGN